MFKAFVNKYLLKAYITLIAAYAVSLVLLVCSLNPDIVGYILFGCAIVQLVLWLFTIVVLISGVIESKRIYRWAASFIFITLFEFIIAIANVHV